MKRLIQIIAIIAMMAGFSFTALPANASNGSSTTTTTTVAAKQGTQSSTKCDKASGSFVAPNGITVLNLRTCFDVKVLKKMGCDTEAGKIEQPAPPRDPKSKCKEKAKVTFKIDYETPPCPTGFIGGKLTLSLKIMQKVKALGLSKSIASGRVDTWAKTRIKMSDKFKGTVTNDCVLIPVITPPPPPVYDECPNIPGNQPKDYVCTTPPPPVYDHCPNIPGDQPSGYICYPPVYDECPNIPGNQPVGYECSPPVEKPLYAQFGEFNDLEVNYTDDHCVTVNFPADHPGTVFWTAKFGSFAVSTKNAQDMVEVCSFYVAPSEVPAGGTDTITVTATDNTTGHSVTQSTDPFVIHPTAGHPEKAQQ